MTRTFTKASVLMCFVAGLLSACTLMTDPVKQTYQGAPKPLGETAFLSHAAYAETCVGMVSYVDDLYLGDFTERVQGLTIAPGSHRIRWVCLSGSGGYYYVESTVRGSVEVEFLPGHRYLSLITGEGKDALFSIKDEGTNFDVRCLDDIVVRNAAGKNDKRVPGCMDALQSYAPNAPMKSVDDPDYRFTK